MIDIHTAAAVATDAAQALFLLSVVGVLAGISRWPRARRPDFMLAFILFLTGTAITQLSVHFGGMTEWGPGPVVNSAFGRTVQVVGAGLFVRACLVYVCPWWGWPSILAAVAVVTAMI